MSIRRLFASVVVLMVLAAPTVHAQDTIYVDVESPATSPDGTSWSTAYPSLNTAVNNVTPNDEIWIAEGVYTPGSDAVLSFELSVDSSKIYGGFRAGDDFADRDPKAKPTVLSGDFEADDDTTVIGTTESGARIGITPSAADINGPNNNHVLTLDADGGITESTVIDGIIITGGQATGTVEPNGSGGGLLCNGRVTDRECSPTLSNVMFVGNEAGINDGGAIYNWGASGGDSSPVIENTVFVGNRSAGNGGAIYNNADGGTDQIDSRSSPQITGAIFVDNNALNGGAIYNFGIDNGNSNPTIINSTFTNNTGEDLGGAIYSAASGGESEPEIFNTILWDNNATGGGKEIYSAGGAEPRLSHTIVDTLGVDTDVSSSVRYLDDSGAGVDFSESTNLAKNPIFPTRSGLAGPDGQLATVDDSVNVTPSSPALDAGDNAAIPDGVSSDIAGAPRIQDLRSDGTETVNIGAYESIVPTRPTFFGPQVLSATGVSFFGQLNPGGAQTTLEFQFAPTTAPDQETVVTKTVEGAGFRPVSVTARTVDPSTTYEVTVEARNEEGIVTNEPFPFDTPTAPDLTMGNGDQSVSVSFTSSTVTGNPSLSSTFIARPGGGGEFTILSTRTIEDFTEGSSDELLLSATVPDSLITPRGVDYVASVATGFLPAAGVDAPLHLPVGFDALPAEGTFQEGSYRMMSVPGRDTDVQGALTDAYGPYRPSQWRVLQWNASSEEYEEFPNLGADAFSTGEAFWLITAEGTGFSIEEGRTVDASTPKSIELDPGWTQVGNPFGFPVSWEAVKAASGLTSDDLDGPFVYRNGQFEGTSTLRPWDGSFVFNATSETQPLTVPPTSEEAPATAGSAASGKAKATTAKTAAPEASAPYTLEVTAQTEDHAQSVWMGLREEASTGRDGLDVAQPPPVEDNVRLSVMESVGKRTVPHAESFKPSGGEGQTWRLVLSSATDKPTTARLDLTSTGQLPEGHDRYVVDLKREARVAPGEKLQIGEGERRILKVIVGEESYADRKSEGITKRGYEDNLQSNYPNPFEEATTLRYSLSEKRSVTLEVYNVLGQRVRTLVNEKKEAGLHQVQWEGENQYGKQVSSGVYFVQLRAGAVQKTQKVVLVR